MKFINVRFYYSYYNSSLKSFFSSKSSFPVAISFRLAKGKLKDKKVKGKEKLLRGNTITILFFCFFLEMYIYIYIYEEMSMNHRLQSKLFLSS